MAFTPFVTSTVCDAGDMNNDFYHISAGDRMPMSGSSLAYKDSTYDIGEDANRWNNVYINNLDIGTGASITGLWNLVDETTLAATATAVEFTGLSGNGDVIYYITFYMHFPSGLGSDWVYMIFNGDSGASYGYQRMYGVAAGSGADRNATTALYSGFIAGTSTANVCYSDSLIYAKSGHERTVLTNMEYGAGGTWIYISGPLAQIWNNTADEITSIKIYSTNPTLATGTNIQLWRST